MKGANAFPTEPGMIFFLNDFMALVFASSETTPDPTRTP